MSKLDRHKEIELLLVSSLLLDHENYRLAPEASRFTQAQLLKLLDAEWNLRVIGQSLADNGYFVEEPLIAVPKKLGSDQYIVVEGNRRLAALKLLTDSESRLLSKDPSFWEELSKHRAQDLSKVPVVVYKTRAELTAFLGYRHFAGVLKWDPLPKARFIDELVNRIGRDADFVEIAREIGSTSTVVRNHYVAYQIMRQARDEFEIDTTKLDEKFSVFYRTLSYMPMTRFLALNKDRTPRQLRKPVPRSKSAALEELIGYVNGTKEVEPVITDSRQLKQLADVIDNRPAREYLRTTRDLAAAWQLTGGQENRLISNLQRASICLDEALRDAYRYKQDPKVKELVRRCAQSMIEILRHHPDIKLDIEETK